ncbi:hypothetical protein ACI78V_12410 [Geodermatophilus sp. SYSU D00742]
MTGQHSGGIDPGVIEPAARVFDVARFGATEELVAPSVPGYRPTSPTTAARPPGRPRPPPTCR